MDQQNQGSNTSSSPTRPAVMDQLTGSQLKELEFHYDAGNRHQFDDVAATYDWSSEVARNVWTWLESGERSAEARPHQGNIPS